MPCGICSGTISRLHCVGTCTWRAAYPWKWPSDIVHAQIDLFLYMAVTHTPTLAYHSPMLALKSVSIGHTVSVWRTFDSRKKRKVNRHARCWKDLCVEHLKCFLCSWMSAFHKANLHVYTYTYAVACTTERWCFALVKRQSNCTNLVCNDKESRQRINKPLAGRMQVLHCKESYRSTALLQLISCGIVDAGQSRLLLLMKADANLTRS